MWLRARESSLCSQTTGLSPHMAATPGFKSQHESSSITPFPTPPILGYTSLWSGFFCLLQLPLFLQASVAPRCRANRLPALTQVQEAPPTTLHHGIASRARVMPISLAPSWHSHLTLLKHWPSSSDMQIISQWPCSTSLIPQAIAMGVFSIWGHL